MFELAGAGMANIDLATGRFLKVNRKLCEIFGFSAEELSELTVHELTHPDDRAVSIERIRAMSAANPQAYAYQKRYIRKDGTCISVAVDATSFVDGNGNAVYGLAMVRDITDQVVAEEALRGSERHFRTLADHAPVAIFQADRYGNNVFVNARWCYMTGRSPEQASGTGWQAAVHPDDLPTLMTDIQAACLTGSEYSGQYRYVRPDGEIVWVQGGGAPVRDDDGQLVGYLGTATDLTNRMHGEWLETDRREVLEMVAQDQAIDVVLARIVRLLERQADGSIGAVFLIDEGAITIQSPRMPAELMEQMRVAPLPLASELIKAAWADADGVGVSFLDNVPVWSDLRAAVAAAGLQTCWTVPIQSNEHQPLGLVSVFCKHDRRPTRTEIELLQMIAKLATITIEHYQTTRQLAHLVRHDRLTGMPNRMMLEDRLQQSINLSKRSGKSVAVLALDIDKFKTVNDTLGHHAGDQLLQQFSQRLSSLLRATDTMARTGGDEFVIVLPELSDAAGAERVARKLVQAMEQPFVIDDHPPVLTSTSIGIALCPGDSTDSPTLLQQADAALYRVKERGRNGFGFYTKA